MPLAPGLLVRTLVRPGGRLTTVVTRRRREPGQATPDRPIPHQPPPEPPVPERRPEEPGESKPSGAGRVPGHGDVAAGFTRPVVRAFAVLGGRARPLGRDDVALDGRRVALARVVAEANRCLLASGRTPIRYPGVSPVKAGR